MKSDEQSRQEREREIKQLREKLSPVSARSILKHLTLTTIMLVTFIYSQIKGTSNGIETLFGLLVIFGTLLFWLWKWLASSQTREWVEQLSVEELGLEFEKNRKYSGQLFIFLTVGLLCWGFSILIGGFDFSLALLVAGGGGLAVTGLMYWLNRESEKIARNLSAKDDI
ncbi:MAG: hypothetical protein ISN29_07610 [Gammaproteobacteria bacterium AqS3]|nr:hypothetical protein [Gammaproteobacteria bacterium AqS3]